MAIYENDPDVVALAGIASALGEPRRLAALAMLAGGERCQCDLVEVLGVSQSTVSTHMAVLRRAGLVESRKDGRWMYFRLAGRNSDRAVTQALSWVLKNLPETLKTLPCCGKDECCP